MKSGSSQNNKLIKALVVMRRAHCEVELADIKVREAQIEYDDPDGSYETATEAHTYARNQQFLAHHNFRTIAASFLDDCYGELIELLSGADKDGDD